MTFLKAWCSLQLSLGLSYTRKRSVSSFLLLCLFISVIYRAKVEGRKNKLHCRPHLMAHKMKQKT